MKQKTSLLTLMVFIACSGHKKESVSATLQEAQQLYRESIASYNKISDSVDSSSSLHPDEAFVGKLEEALKEWHDNLVDPTFMGVTIIAMNRRHSSPMNNTRLCNSKSIST